MKRFSWLMISVMTVAVMFSGCEWSSSGSGESWDDSWSWVDFSGTYRAEDGGVLVSGFTGTPGTEPSEIDISGEILGSINSTDSTYNGSTDNKPVKEGSMTIQSGSYIWTDNGDGTLSGTAGTTGSINYESGVWSIDLQGQIIAAGELITAAYTYTSGGTDGQEDPGNTGGNIYSFVVTQTGNRLKFVDSLGAVYEGNFFSLEPAGGDDTGKTSGIVTGQFEVSGNSTSGARVTITGSFTGTYTAGIPDVDADGNVVGYSYGTMTGKAMNGTWVEDTITGDIKAISGT